MGPLKLKLRNQIFKDRKLKEKLEVADQEISSSDGNQAMNTLVLERTETVKEIEQKSNNEEVV